MDKNQKFLIDILSAAIRNEKISIHNTKEVNLKVVFDEARKQDICALLYPTIKKINEGKWQNDEVVSKWKKAAILSGIAQSRFANQMCKVFDQFKEKNIEVIALKGIILRNLYPKEDFRTMSDADILVHKNDIGNIKNILLNMGYIEESFDSKHSIFVHNNHLPIEVHWLTMDENYVRDSKYLEKTIWNNLITRKLCDTLVMAPSVENQIVHLCLHMASHMIYSGFGLRQLCDLVLLIEFNQDKINWDIVYEGLNKCKIVNFTSAIFEVCRKLFKFKVPDVLYKKELEDDQYIDILILHIFSDGVYGKINQKIDNTNLLLNYESSKKINKSLRSIKYFIKYIFPYKERFNKRYAYAQKYPIFIPIAWIHRLIFAIFISEYSLNEKSNLLNSNISILGKKTELLRWLELK